jgi:hypothetical protein
VPTNGGNGESGALDSSSDGGTKGLVAVALEQRVELLDATPGELGLTVRDLGEKGERLRSKVEHLLALLVELGALAVDRGDLG